MYNTRRKTTGNRIIRISAKTRESAINKFRKKYPNKAIYYVEWIK